MLSMTFVFFWYLASFVSLLICTFLMPISYAFNHDDLRIEHDEQRGMDCACASHVAVLIGRIQSLYLEPDCLGVLCLSYLAARSH